MNTKLQTVTLFAVMSLPAVALADRGGGSIRAAGRSEPAQAPERAPMHVEPQRPVVVEHRDVHVDVHVPPPHVEAPHIETHVEAPAVRRDWDDHDEDLRHGGGFARGPSVRIVRGSHFHDLPHHISIVFANRNYFYDDDGNYYEQQAGDYVVVQPPVGALVPMLPPGVVTVVSGPTTFYYLDGVFYVSQPPNFAVVNPPPGIVVPELPAGASQIIINGQVCYQFAGLNYLPSVQDGVTVYTVTPA